MNRETVINWGDCQLDATVKINVGHDRGRAVHICNEHLATTLEKAIQKSRKAVVFGVDNKDHSPRRCEYRSDTWVEIL